MDVILLQLARRLFSMVLVVISLLCSGDTQAQKVSPSPKPSAAPQTSRHYLFPLAGVFCGVGATTSTVSTRPTGGCGAGVSFIPGTFTEVGVMGPQANRSQISGYVSTDANLPLAPSSITYLPLAIIGYSRLFETGHALDYGLALDLPKPFRSNGAYPGSLRLELRDYWTFANPAQHNVMFRMGLLSLLPD